MTCPGCGRDLWVCTDQATGDYYWCPACHRRFLPQGEPAQPSTVHLTADGATTLCGRERAEVLGLMVHVTYAGRELDAGRWCQDCTAARAASKPGQITLPFVL